MYWYLFQRSSKQLPVTNQDFPRTKRSTKQRIPLPSRVRYVALVMAVNGWGKSWGRVGSVENIWVSLILSVQIRSSGLGVSWICSRLSKWLTFHLFVQYIKCHGSSQLDLKCSDHFLGDSNLTIIGIYPCSDTFTSCVARSYHNDPRLHLRHKTWELNNHGMKCLSKPPGPKWNKTQ